MNWQKFLSSSLEDPLLARVVAGEYSLNEVEGLEQYKGAVKVYRHPLFNNNTKVNDLALIEVFELLHSILKESLICKIKIVELTSGLHQRHSVPRCPSGSSGRGDSRRNLRDNNWLGSYCGE